MNEVTHNMDDLAVDMKSDGSLATVGIRSKKKYTTLVVNVPKNSDIAILLNGVWVSPGLLIEMVRYRA